MRRPGRGRNFVCGHASLRCHVISTCHPKDWSGAQDLRSGLTRRDRLTHRNRRFPSLPSFLSHLLLLVSQWNTPAYDRVRQHHVDLIVVRS